MNGSARGAPQKDRLAFHDVLRSREFFRGDAGCGCHGTVEANSSGAWSDGEDPAAVKSATRRDRHLLLAALVHALLTLLRAAGERWSRPDARASGDDRSPGLARETKNDRWSTFASRLPLPRDPCQDSSGETRFVARAEPNEHCD